MQQRNLVSARSGPCVHRACMCILGQGAGRRGHYLPFAPVRSSSSNTQTRKKGLTFTDRQTTRDGERGKTKLNYISNFVWHLLLLLAPWGDADGVGLQGWLGPSDFPHFRSAPTERLSQAIRLTASRGHRHRFTYALHSHLYPQPAAARAGARHFFFVPPTCNTPHRHIKYSHFPPHRASTLHTERPVYNHRSTRIIAHPPPASNDIGFDGRLSACRRASLAWSERGPPELLNPWTTPGPP